MFTLKGISLQVAFATHSLTHLLTYLLTHSLTHSLTHLLAGKSQHGKCHVNLLAWSAYNKYVVSVASRKVLMWDPYTFDVLCTLDGFTSNVVDICVSDSNSKLFVTLSDKSVR